MMTIPNTVSEFSKYAAQEFLQTVVFIDDRIYDRENGSVSESKQVSLPKSRTKALKSANQKTTDNTGEIVAVSEHEQYSPYDIVTSFAKNK